MDMENNPLISQDENGKPIFCLPNNRWVHYHELEHEKWHRNSFKALLLDHYKLDIDKEISTIVDFGYGDILCNLNYFRFPNIRLESPIISIVASGSYLAFWHIFAYVSRYLHE